MKNAPYETTWPQLLKDLVAGRTLSSDQARWAMDSIMAGEAPAASFGAFFALLSSRGETVEEVAGFSESLQSNGRPLSIQRKALDIVGTGGDGHNTVNISTMASLVAAGAGIPVVKHGNRSASSKTGTADVLERVGVNLSLNPKQVEQVFEETSMAFVFAPAFFPAMRHVAPLRKELGIPTVFNLLGPLINPGRPSASAIGASSEQRGRLIASTLLHRGSQALVFTGHRGLDELSTAGENLIWEVRDGWMREYAITADQLGLEPATLEDLVGGEPEENAEVLRKTIGGELKGPILDTVLLNAAAGITAFESASAEEPLPERLIAQIERARRAVESGTVTDALARWAEATQAHSDQASSQSA